MVRDMETLWGFIYEGHCLDNSPKKSLPKRAFEKSRSTSQGDIVRPRYFALRMNVKASESGNFNPPGSAA